jgi:hypothetical protein
MPESAVRSDAIFHSKNSGTGNKCINSVCNLVSIELAQSKTDPMFQKLELCISFF